MTTSDTATPAELAVVRRLLERHGKTFCEEIGIRLERNTPSVLFQWLCAALLMSARISGGIAVRAARALFREGWRTPRRMAAATWEARTRVLNRSGYARYDEKTSRMLADTAELVLHAYRGDLRRLREAAERDPSRMRQLVREAKGIGDVGVDIFFREVQAVWPEIYPFADRKALKCASRLGLPDDAERLARLVSRSEFPRFVAGLVRVELAGDHEEILAE